MPKTPLIQSNLGSQRGSLLPSFEEKDGRERERPQNGLRYPTKPPHRVLKKKTVTWDKTSAPDSAPRNGFHAPSSAGDVSRHRASSSKTRQYLQNSDGMLTENSFSFSKLRFSESENGYSSVRSRTELVLSMRQSNVILSPRVYDSMSADLLTENESHASEQSVKSLNPKIQQVTFGPMESDAICELYFGSIDSDLLAAQMQPPSQSMQNVTRNAHPSQEKSPRQNGRSLWRSLPHSESSERSYVPRYANKKTAPIRKMTVTKRTENPHKANSSVTQKASNHQPSSSFRRYDDKENLNIEGSHTKAKLRNSDYTCPSSAPRYLNSTQNGAADFRPGANDHFDASSDNFDHRDTQIDDVSYDTSEINDDTYHISDQQMEHERTAIRSPKHPDYSHTIHEADMEHLINQRLLQGIAESQTSFIKGLRENGTKLQEDSSYDSYVDTESEMRPNFSSNGDLSEIEMNSQFLDHTTNSEMRPNFPVYRKLAFDSDGIVSDHHNISDSLHVSELERSPTKYPAFHGSEASNLFQRPRNLTGSYGGSNFAESYLRSEPMTGHPVYGSLRPGDGAYSGARKTVHFRDPVTVSPITLEDLGISGVEEPVMHEDEYRRLKIGRSSPQLNVHQSDLQMTPEESSIQKSPSSRSVKRNNVTKCSMKVEIRGQGSSKRKVNKVVNLTQKARSTSGRSVPSQNPGPNIVQLPNNERTIPGLVMDQSKDYPTGTAQQSSNSTSSHPLNVALSPALASKSEKMTTTSHEGHSPSMRPANRANGNTHATKSNGAQSVNRSSGGTSKPLSLKSKSVQGHSSSLSCKARSQSARQAAIPSPHKSHRRSSYSKDSSSRSFEGHSSSVPSGRRSHSAQPSAISSAREGFQSNSYSINPSPRSLEGPSSPLRSRELREMRLQSILLKSPPKERQNVILKARYFKIWKNNVRLLKIVKNKERRKNMKADSFYKFTSLAKHFFSWRTHILEQQIIADELHCFHLLKKGLLALHWASKSKKIKREQAQVGRTRVKLNACFGKWRKMYQRRRIENLGERFCHWRARCTNKIVIRKFTDRRHSITLVQMFSLWKERFTTSVQARTAVQHYHVVLTRKIWHMWRVYAAEQLVRDSQKDVAEIKREVWVLSRNFSNWKASYEKMKHSKIYACKKVLNGCMKRWKHFTSLESLEHQKEVSAARQMRRNHLLRRHFSVWSVEMKLSSFVKCRENTTTRSCLMVWKSEMERHRAICSEVDGHRNQILLKKSFHAIRDYAKNRLYLRNRGARKIEELIVRKSLTSWYQFAMRKIKLENMQKTFYFSKMKKNMRSSFLKWRNRLQVINEAREAQMRWTLSCVKKAACKWYLLLRRKQMEKLCDRAVARKQLQVMEGCFECWKMELHKRRRQDQRGREAKVLRLRGMMRRILRHWYIRAKESTHIKPFIEKLEKGRTRRHFGAWMMIRNRRAMKENMTRQIKHQTMKACFVKWKTKMNSVDNMKLAEEEYKRLLLKRAFQGWKKFINRCHGEALVSNQHERIIVLRFFYTWATKTKFKQIEESKRLRKHFTEKANIQEILVCWRNAAVQQKEVEEREILRFNEQRDTLCKRSKFSYWMKAFQNQQKAKLFASQSTDARLRVILVEWHILASSTIRDGVNLFKSSMDLLRSKKSTSSSASRSIKSSSDVTRGSDVTSERDFQMANDSTSPQSEQNAHKGCSETNSDMETKYPESQEPIYPEIINPKTNAPHDHHIILPEIVPSHSNRESISETSSTAMENATQTSEITSNLLTNCDSGILVKDLSVSETDESFPIKLYTDVKNTDKDALDHSHQQQQEETFSIEELEKSQDSNIRSSLLEDPTVVETSKRIPAVFVQCSSPNASLNSSNVSSLSSGDGNNPTLSSTAISIQSSTLPPSDDPYLQPVLSDLSHMSSLPIDDRCRWSREFNGEHSESQSASFKSSCSHENMAHESQKVSDHSTNSSLIAADDLTDKMDESLPTIARTSQTVPDMARSHSEEYWPNPTVSFMSPERTHHNINRPGSPKSHLDMSPLLCSYQQGESLDSLTQQLEKSFSSSEFRKDLAFLGYGDNIAKAMVCTPRRLCDQGTMHGFCELVNATNANDKHSESSSSGELSSVHDDSLNETSFLTSDDLDEDRNLEPCYTETLLRKPKPTLPIHLSLDDFEMSTTEWLVRLAVIRLRYRPLAFAFHQWKLLIYMKRWKQEMMSHLSKKSATLITRNYFRNWRDSARKMKIAKEKAEICLKSASMESWFQFLHHQKTKKRLLAVAEDHRNWSLVKPAFYSWKKKFEQKMALLEILKCWQNKTKLHSSPNSKDSRIKQRMDQELVMHYFLDWKLRVKQIKMAEEHMEQTTISRCFKRWSDWVRKKKMNAQKINDFYSKHLKSKVLQALRRHVLLMRIVKVKETFSHRSNVSSLLTRWHSYTQAKKFHRLTLTKLSEENRRKTTESCFKQWKQELMKVKLAKVMHRRSLMKKVLNGWKNETMQNMNEQIRFIRVKEIVDKHSKRSVMLKWVEEMQKNSKANSLKQKQLLMQVVKCWELWKDRVAHRKSDHFYSNSIKRKCFKHWMLLLSMRRNANDNARSVLQKWHEMTTRSKKLSYMADQFQSKSNNFTVEITFNLWLIACEQSYKANHHFNRRTISRWKYRCKVHQNDSNAVYLYKRAAAFRSLRYHWLVWKRRKQEADSARYCNLKVMSQAVLVWTTKLEKRKRADRFRHEQEERNLSKILATWRSHVVQVQSERKVIADLRDSKARIITMKTFMVWLKSCKNNGIACSFHERTLKRESFDGLLQWKNEQKRLKSCYTQAVHIVQNIILRAHFQHWKALYRKSRMLSVSCDRMISIKKDNLLKKSWKQWFKAKEKCDLHRMYQRNLALDATRKWRRYATNRIEQRRIKEERHVMVDQFKDKWLTKRVFCVWQRQYKVKLMRSQSRANLLKKHWNMWTVKTSMSVCARGMDEVRVLQTFWNAWRMEFVKRKAVETSLSTVDKDLMKKVFRSWRYFTSGRRTECFHSDAESLLARTPKKKSKIPVLRKISH